MRCPTKAETLYRPCPDCRGWANVTPKCPACAGTGVIRYRYGKVVAPQGK